MDTSATIESASFDLTIEELAQILLTLDEDELDTLEILLDPQARLTVEQSMQDIKEGDTLSIDNW